MTAGLYRVLAARIVHGDHQEAHPGDDIMLSAEDATSLLALGAVKLTSECDPAEATLFGDPIPLSATDAEGGEVRITIDEADEAPPAATTAVLVAEPAPAPGAEPAAPAEIPNP